ncbi:MAG: dihydropteroate synthase [Vicinamibacterales bacterium]
MFAPRRVYTVPLTHGALLLGERPLVMGIVNVTPDSFAEGARRLDPARAIDAALQMEAEGADIVDVGGESTRPGAEPVAAEEELARILPVLEDLARRLRIPISVDTYKADVARAALEVGAGLINDVSGLRYDPELGSVVAEYGAAIVLMHTRGRSKAMYVEAAYADVVTEVVAELRESVAIATAAGIPFDRVIVDPGIGFAKRPPDSYGVLARLPELAAALDRPLLVGASRKSFLQEATGGRPAAERDWGTAAAVTAAVLGGAHIVRVHAVGEMTQVVRTAEEIRKAGLAGRGVRLQADQSG